MSDIVNEKKGGLQTRSVGCFRLTDKWDMLSTRAVRVAAIWVLVYNTKKQAG